MWMIHDMEWHNIVFDTFSIQNPRFYTACNIEIEMGKMNETRK